MENSRILGKTGIKVNELALGCEHLQGKDESLVRDVIARALEKGVDFLDVFMSEPNVRTYIGRALAGCRKQVKIQGHIGSVWTDGQYAVRRELELCRSTFDDLLTRLNMDYIDIGFIHNLDNPREWEDFISSPTMQYTQELKKQGVLHAVGLSTHNPITALTAVNSGLIDVLMFSLNPTYDLLPPDKEIWALFEDKPFDFSGMESIRPERLQLYRACDAKGVAITAMKILAAGSLLKAERSPYGKAMTVPQCLHYALTRPAVAAVMLGMQTVEEVDAAFAYYQATEEQKDYASVLAQRGQGTLDGRCMYCNHCLPCPEHIDIAAINKYLDLCELDGVPAATLRQHYDALSATAADCISCHACEKRCPFSVPITQRMERAKTIFGK
ncbi:MAG: aldo/keto reductase [Eubacteriales bacterium]|nr:aldo/keto reductase [Eubacteriales bacterium]